MKTIEKIFLLIALVHGALTAVDDEAAERNLVKKSPTLSTVCVHRDGGKTLDCLQENALQMVQKLGASSDDGQRQAKQVGATLNGSSTDPNLAQSQQPNMWDIFRLRPFAPNIFAGDHGSGSQHSSQGESFFKLL